MPALPVLVSAAVLVATKEREKENQKDSQLILIIFSLARRSSTRQAFF